MKISLQWLRALLSSAADNLTSAEVAETLASLGSPVEDIHAMGEGLGDIIVARVEETAKHPNADRLSLCRVFDGEETVDVVCGAPNVKAGSYYPFAPVGATLPGGFKIGKAKIRGVHSNGMLCSANELGLGDDHDGILELVGDYGIGGSLIDALGLDDERLEVEITANRGDL